MYKVDENFDVTNLVAPIPNLVKELNFQLKSDFEKIGLKFNIEATETDFDTCNNKLVDAVEWLFDNDRSRLMQLLYRIDISESALQRNLDALSGKNAIEQIAWLILCREAQKVWFKHEYSKSKKV